MERKDFIKKFAIGGSVLLVAPAFFESCSNGTDAIINSSGGTSSGEITIDLTSSEFSTLGNVGGFAYKGNIIIIHNAENQYTALSKICTHQGCTVFYDAAHNRLPCPCHGSLFNISGGVINGPAQQSLKEYNVKVEGNTLTIS